MTEAEIKLTEAFTASLLQQAHAKIAQQASMLSFLNAENVGLRKRNEQLERSWCTRLELLIRRHLRNIT